MTQTRSTDKADKRRKGLLTANVKNSPKAQKHLEDEEARKKLEKDLAATLANDQFWASTPLRVYTETPSYRVRKTPEGNYKFIPNHRRRSSLNEELPEKDPEDGQYNFVIIYNELTGLRELKIIKIAAHDQITATHFGLAGKAERVVAAGELYIYQGKIFLINDRTGTYCMQLPEDISISKTISKINKYKQYFKEALQEFDLPTNCVRFYSDYQGACSPTYEDALKEHLAAQAEAFEENRKIRNCKCRFFYAAATGLAITSAAAGYLLSTFENR